MEGSAAGSGPRAAGRCTASIRTVDAVNSRLLPPIILFLALESEDAGFAGTCAPSAKGAEAQDAWKVIRQPSEAPFPMRLLITLLTAALVAGGSVSAAALRKESALRYLARRGGS